MADRDPVAALEQLGAMKERGLITDEEYAAKRAEILAQMNAPSAAPTPPVAPPAATPPAPAKKQASPAVGCAGAVVLLVAAYLLFGKGTRMPAGNGNGGGNATPGGGGGGGGAPVTLLDLSGSGIKNSSSFTTTGPWTVAYTYDCANFGMNGNFIVTVGDSSGTPVAFPVNELGDKGSSSSTVYDTGTLHLEMNSECSWHVKATQP